MTGRASNRGATSLKLRRRTDPMRDFDRLPADLRAWLHHAELPWSPVSVRRAFARALAVTGDRQQALAELDRRARHKLARDAAIVWGAAHPQAGQGGCARPS
ncbi:DUF6525 family protein [Rhodovulum adriaticum]|uniref:Uncharacterized protein n=1 Tax=Rhodovulum adriaticum TaxID=35804 RepID=A0A4V2SL45_RHOAD|nr:DUF6525 family protein [Rhodovulum adriaticum]MBK1637016.1 hypothetical protein [Rhodovulum adriaticum]TCP21996.1 hypothetical protein EV656_10842 [Rhodovulum adriaticum]